ncbi:MAG: LCP family protein [Ilumatobacteraceae bacterium]
MAQRLVLAVNLVVIIACFVAAGGLLLGKRVREGLTAAPQATLRYSNGIAVNSDGVFVGDPNATFPVADAAAQNFLLLGDDSHACVDPSSQWAGAADPTRDNNSQRSDTIMVVRIDPSSRRAAVLSFPRDLWVKIPNNGKARINSAYRQGDYSLMAQTLFNNFGVKVDHYLQIDFCTFKTVVDAVGGVKVPFQYPARDTHINLNITAAGCHTFTGDEALAYVRSRYYEYLDSDGKWKSDNAYDLGRISRQQDFLRRILQAATNKGVFNASVAKGLLKALTKYVVVDQNLTIDEMLQFVGVLHDVQPSGIPTYQIEVTRLLLPGNDVLQAHIDGSRMKAILDIFRGRTPLAQAPDQVAAAATVGSATTGSPAVGLRATTSTVDPPSTPSDPTQGNSGIVPPDIAC